jgi:hypothetical protein
MALYRCYCQNALNQMTARHDTIATDLEAEPGEAHNLCGNDSVPILFTRTGSLIRLTSGAWRAPYHSTAQGQRSFCPQPGTGPSRTLNYRLSASRVGAFNVTSAQV